MDRMDLYNKILDMLEETDNFYLEDTANDLADFVMDNFTPKEKV